MRRDRRERDELIEARRDLELRGLVECVGLSAAGQPVYALTEKAERLGREAAAIATALGEDEEIIFEWLLAMEPITDRP